MIQILYTELNCQNESLLKVIYLIKTILNMAQVVIPIILIIWCIWDAIRNMISQNGWDGKIIKRIINKFLAAVFVFVLPTIINIVLELLGQNGYQVGTCWEEASKEKANNTISIKEEVKNAIEKGNDAIMEALQKRKDLFR